MKLPKRMLESIHVEIVFGVMVPWLGHDSSGWVTVGCLLLWPLLIRVLAGHLVLITLTLTVGLLFYRQQPCLLSYVSLCNFDLLHLQEVVNAIL